MALSLKYQEFEIRDQISGVQLYKVKCASHVQCHYWPFKEWTMSSVRPSNSGSMHTDSWESTKVAKEMLKLQPTASLAGT